MNWYELEVRGRERNMTQSLMHNPRIFLMRQRWSYVQVQAEGEGGERERSESCYYMRPSPVIFQLLPSLGPVQGRSYIISLLPSDSRGRLTLEGKQRPIFSLPAGCHYCCSWTFPVTVTVPG
jgi:hypothetical protein